jgi:hypothetical protein
MADDQTTFEKMAKEIEELKARISAYEERDYRHQIARAMKRHTVTNKPITSISGPLVLVRSNKDVEEQFLRQHPLKCETCYKPIDLGDTFIKVVCEYDQSGPAKNPNHHFHESCVKKAIHDSSDERLFEEWTAKPTICLYWP